MSTLKVDAIRHNSATSDAITTAADGTCTAKLTSIGGGGLSHRNLVINGDMRIAQRGTSSTSTGYSTVDRFNLYHANTAVTITQSQQSSASSDTPYTLGFRKFFRMALPSAGAANANAEIGLYYNLEAQDVANSGWNHTSSTSNITLSFWFRCSTNQTFYAYLRTRDGTNYTYPFSFTASGNSAWTKITKTIPGNANLQIDDNTERGLSISIIPFYGTDLTNNLSVDQWSAYDTANRMPDMASTWLTAGASTFDITGLQLEVGDTATSFEHRSFGEELSRCQRYCQVYVNPRLRGVLGSGGSSDFNRMGMTLLNTLRTDPSATWSGTQSVYGGGGTASITGINSLYVDPYSFEIDGAASGSLTGGTGTAVVAYTGGNEATITLSAEL
jgi:hypothetical protein